MSYPRTQSLGSVLLSAALTASLAACMVGEDEAASAARQVSADEDLPGDLTTGDVVMRGGVAVVVPGPGETVAVTVDHDDGTTEELIIVHRLDGKIDVADIPEEPEVLASGSTAACADAAYSLTGHRWTQPLAWSFQDASTPTDITAANAEKALTWSALAITSSHNDCGLADEVSAAQQYLGRTTKVPNLSATSTSVVCGTRDGANVVGFGVLPSTYLGVACTWSAAGVAVESDIRFNRAFKWFTGGVPAGCLTRNSLLSVATHEFGHAFGLGHVSQSTNGNQTMSTHAAACSTAKYTLGLGDVSALRALY